MKRFWLNVLTAGLLFGSLTARAELSVLLSRRKGATISCGDRVISHRTLFQVATPGWTRRIFQLDRPKTVFSPRPDGGSITAHTSEVELNDLDVSVSGDSATLKLRAKYTGSEQAICEFMPFAILSDQLRNAKYSAEFKNGKKRSGVIGSKMLKLKDMIKFSAVFAAGRLTVESLDGRPFSLLDKRRQRYGNDPEQFIVMRSDMNVTPGKELTGEFKLTFVPAPPAVGKRVSAPPAPVVATERTIPAPRFPLLPEPKQRKYAGSMTFFELKPGMPLVVRGGDGEGRILRHAEKIFGARGVKVRAGDKPVFPGIFVEIGKGIPESPEGYTLSVEENGVRIGSATERGAFYALQTLRGLEKDGTFPIVEVKDWPDFAFRGLHTKSNSGTYMLFSRVIERVAAPLKINSFVLECQYVRWKTLGGAKHPRGMSKEDFVELAKIAHENYIDFIPLQQTLSHNQWLFANGRNRDLAEDPTPSSLLYNYNVSDPRVYELLEKVFDELIAASRTPYIHIGHDELDDWGKARFPYRPENVKLGAKELLRRDMMWHIDYAKKRGVKLMMWHDVLVAKNEAPGLTKGGAIGGTEQLRKTLPRDIVMCVWSYKPHKAFPDVDLFLDDGYPVIGCTWECGKSGGKGNIGCFSRYCFGKKGVLGMLETTWSHFGTETMLNSHYQQATAYVTAAAFFWNVKAGLGRFKSELVLPALLDGPDAPRKEKLTSIPLKVNTVMPNAPGSFNSLPEKLVTADGVTFPVVKVGKSTGALRGVPDMKKLTIPLNGLKCERLYLLSTLLETPSRIGVPLVRVRVVYADGGSGEFFIRSSAYTVGYNGAPHFTDPDGKTSTTLYEAFPPFAPAGYANPVRSAAMWRAGKKTEYRLAPIVWKNPRPGVALDKLELSEFNPTYAWYLLSLAAGSDI